ncbi:uncharacterized protein LOC116265128 [Nymphaea colorata]|nr:uncharacterized protein LOC116265128 [Nymphaea colorata]
MPKTLPLPFPNQTTGLAAAAPPPPQSPSPLPPPQPPPPPPTTISGRKRSEGIISVFMGLCVSSHDEPTHTAMVILPNGSLQEFRQASAAKHALDGNPDCFVCNSDSMCYDEAIPPMAPDDELLPGQVYFVLPDARRKVSLSASDMAALAVKASLAMQKSGKKGKGRRPAFCRVVPVCERAAGVGSGEFEPRDDGLRKVELRRPGSVRRLQRVASKKARFACGSFKLGLSTIHEEDTVN